MVLFHHDSNDDDYDDYEKMLSCQIFSFPTYRLAPMYLHSVQEISHLTFQVRKAREVFVCNVNG